MSSEKVRSTNFNCLVIADVRHDRSEPCVDVLFGGYAWGVRQDGAAGNPHPQSTVVLVPHSFVSSAGDGHRLMLRGAHLTAQEMLTAFASHIQARAAEESGDNKPEAGAGR